MWSTRYELTPEGKIRATGHKLSRRQSASGELDVSGKDIAQEYEPLR